MKHTTMAELLREKERQDEAFAALFERIAAVEGTIRIPNEILEAFDEACRVQRRVDSYVAYGVRG